tara:strand:+ start:98 stop:760 length:663 start_codon:yes stop_codon:yes gene_type:complete
MKITSNVLVVANGVFPHLEETASLFKLNPTVICCDGAVEKILQAGYEPNVIIGDMDSISDENKTKYSEIIVQIDDQDNNDLNKALSWLDNKDILSATIIGADGDRDDHTLGNTLLLLEKKFSYDIQMKTQAGMYSVINTNLMDKDESDSYTKTFNTRKEKSVSIFCTDRQAILSSKGLKYELRDFQFEKLYEASLNIAISESFSISCNKPNTSILVYREN